jgi:hypothetical protein
MIPDRHTADTKGAMKRARSVTPVTERKQRGFSEGIHTKF